MQLVSFFLNSDSVKSKFVLLYIRNFHFVYNTIIIESLHVVIKFDFASLIKKMCIQIRIVKTQLSFLNYEIL